MGTANPQVERCSYAYRDGSRCAADIEGKGQFCFWHDPAANKESPDVKDRLEQWARSNRSLEGIVLRYAQLEGIKLGGSKGLDLSNADFFHANLKKARLTNVNLSDANLMKVDLSRSRMSQVKIQGANLMGLHLRGAKLDKVDWGKAVLHEQHGLLAEEEGDEDKAIQSYREALSVYQHLGRVYERNSDRRMASWLLLREMEVQRKMMTRGSAEWLWSTVVNLVCGYGEKPLRVIGLALVLIVICAGLYSYLGVFGVDLDLGYISELSLAENIDDFVDCLIYSATVFVSVGYSEMSDLRGGRIVASIESFVGGLVIAFFIALSLRKLFR